MIKRIMACLFLLLSVAYLYFALQMKFGTMSRPGSGFLPILTGGLASVLALIDFIGIFRSKDKRTEEINLKVVGFVILGLVVYILLLKYVPYILATFITLLYLFKVARLNGWVKPLLIAACSSFCFYFVFEYLLAVPFP